jgi:hypothetical protein
MTGRRWFLSGLAVSTAGLWACDRGEAALLAMVCDPDLVDPVQRALLVWPELRAGRRRMVSDRSERALGQKMESLRGGLVVTREPRQANRLQRLGLSRLEHRWTRDIAGAPAILLVTRGDPGPQGRALRFARWLASPAAEPALGGVSAP